MPDWVDGGAAATVLLAIIAGGAWLGRRLFARGGPVDRVVETHLRYVEESITTQKVLSDRLGDHMEAEETELGRLRRAALHGCALVRTRLEELGPLSPAAKTALEAIERELMVSAGEGKG